MELCTTTISESAFMKTLRQCPTVERAVIAAILQGGDVQAAIDSVPGARERLGGRTLRRLR
jgi:hypothetical protein